MYDRQMRRAEKAGLSDMRKALVTQARGAVLEIGAGTGANLGLYPPAVTSLSVTEPDVFMLKRLERHAKAEAPAAMVLRAPAEDLPFEDATFDTVVSTLVLCGVDDQPRAVREIRRVLRPGAASCSSSTYGPVTRRRPRSRTVSTGSTGPSSVATATAPPSTRSRPRG